jgi:superfamily I DNA and RNA helicase
MNNFVWMADEWRQKVAWLKSQSTYYPQIFPHIDRDTVYLSTLVRIKRDDKWYTVHCVESCIADMAQMAQFFTIFNESVYKIIHLHKLTGTMEDLDTLQMDESERMMKMYTEQNERLHLSKNSDQ